MAKKAFKSKKTQYNELIQLLDRYKKFMPFCPEYCIEKLCTEMVKLTRRIEYLSTLDDIQIKGKFEYSIEVANSKMNSVTN